MGDGIKSVVTLKSKVKSSPQKRVLNSFFSNPVKNTEIEKLIKILNHNKSLGPCSIPVFLKKPLTFLINLSFQQGTFPEALKTARVTPNFK